MSLATCFVCQQQGHIARDCPKNAHGIYVSGGSCKRCGSKAHLARDCAVPDPRDASAAAAASDDAVDQGSASNTKEGLPKAARPAAKSPAAGGDDLEGNVATVSGVGDDEDPQPKKKKKKKVVDQRL